MDCANPDVSYVPPIFEERRVSREVLARAGQGTMGLTGATLRLEIRRDPSGCVKTVTIGLTTPQVEIDVAASPSCYREIRKHEEHHIQDYLRITALTARWIQEGVEPSRAYDQWVIEINKAGDALDTDSEFSRLGRACR